MAVLIVPTTAIAQSQRGLNRCSHNGRAAIQTTAPIFVSTLKVACEEPCLIQSPMDRVNYCCLLYRQHWQKLIPTNQKSSSCFERLPFHPETPCTQENVMSFGATSDLQRNQKFQNSLTFQFVWLCGCCLLVLLVVGGVFVSRVTMDSSSGNGVDPVVAEGSCRRSSGCCSSIRSSSSSSSCSSVEVSSRNSGRTAVEVIVENRSLEFQSLEFGIAPSTVCFAWKYSILPACCSENASTPAPGPTLQFWRDLASCHKPASI